MVFVAPNEAQFGREALDFSEVLTRTWNNRGDEKRCAIPVRLPARYKSGYGLPMSLAYREYTLPREAGAVSTKSWCIAVFEDRVGLSQSGRLKPIGALVFEECLSIPGNLASPRQIVIWNDDSIIDHQKDFVSVHGGEGANLGTDLLFSDVVDAMFASSPLYSVGGAAIRVGFDVTYGMRRQRVLNQLRDRGVDKDIVKDFSARGQDLRAGKLDKFVHSNLGIGRLMFNALVDVSHRLNIDSIYVAAYNQHSARVIQSLSMPTMHGIARVMLPSYVRAEDCPGDAQVVKMSVAPVS